LGFVDDALEQRQRLGLLPTALQAVAEVRAHVLVPGIALVGGAVAGLGLLELPLAEIDVGELQVQVRLV